MSTQLVTIDVTPQETLSSQENHELSQLEKKINLGIRVYSEVGKALAVIQNKRLYRERCKTFELYCQERWDLSRPQAYRLIDAAAVIADLSPIGDTLPVNETQCRALAPLSTQKRREAWKEVVATASDGKITGSLVQDVVKRLLRESDTPPTSRSNSGTPGTSKPSGSTRKPDKKLEIVSTNNCHEFEDLAEGALSTTDECDERLVEKLALECPLVIVKAVTNLKPEILITALKKNKASKKEIEVLSNACYNLSAALDEAFGY